MTGIKVSRWGGTETLVQIGRWASLQRGNEPPDGPYARLRLGRIRIGLERDRISVPGGSRLRYRAELRYDPLIGSWLKYRFAELTVTYLGHPTMR